MAISRGQKCALAFTAVCCILFGAGIAATGLLFQYHDDYNDDYTNGMGSDGAYQYYYTQYWLGAPLIVLGVLILSFLCCKAKPLLYLCIFLSSLTLTLAIAAVVLEGPKWRTWLSRMQLVDDKDVDDVNTADGERCNFVYNGIQLRMTCKEILYATVMQSILVGCSILSIVVSQLVIFISIRALGNARGSTYNVSTKNQYDNMQYNGQSSNINITSEM